MVGPEEREDGRAAEGAVTIEGIDHIVLTVTSVERTRDFYARALRMGVATFEGGRVALTFGSQKINLHEAGREYEPKAARPTPGSGDVCFLLARGTLDAAVAHLKGQDVAIEEGPVGRTGATGPLRSVYVRDPDMNLIELAEPAS